MATENVFKRTVARAEKQGMKVNIDKTAMLAIHDSMTYRPKPYIEDQNGERIEAGQGPIRIVGFHFDHRPTPSAHVMETVKKIRRR